MTWKKGYDEAAAQAEGANLSTEGIRFAEKAADPVVPIAGEGGIYVKNTAPSTLVFVDDTGVEVTLGQAGGSVGRILTVASSGAQYTSITAALAASASGDTVLVYPGAYAENVAVPTGVRLIGSPTNAAVSITGSDAVGIRVELAADTTLREIGVVGPSSGAGPAITANHGAGAPATLKDVGATGGGGTGPLIQKTGAGNLLMDFVAHVGGTAGSFIDTSGGTTTIIGGGLAALAGTTTDFIKMSATAVITGQILTVNSGYTATDLFDISGTANLNLKGLQVDAAASITNSLHIVADGVTINLSGCHPKSSAFDLLADPGLTGTGTTLLYEGALRNPKTSVPATFFDNSTTVVIGVDDIEKQLSIRGKATVTEKLEIGRPGNAGGLTVGEGGPYQVASDHTTIVAYTYDASAASGSRFAAIANINSNNTLLADIGDRVYIGGPDPFWAAQFVVGVAGSSEGNWIGKTWAGAFITTQVMGVSKTNAVRTGHTTLEAVETQYITWDRAIQSGWVAVDNQLDTIPNTGTALYWIALEASATLATAPRVDEIKVRGSDVDTIPGAAPRTVLWGRSRVGARARIDAATLKRHGADASTLVDADITSTITTPAQSFTDGDRLPLSWVLPEDCDTSCSLRVYATFISDAATALNVTLVHKVVPSGAAVSSSETGVTSIVTTITPAGANDLTEDAEITGVTSYILIEAYDPGDRLFMDFKRSSATGGSLILLYVTIEYVRWQIGTAL